ncbi:MAG: hypothetical protein ACRD0J_11340 [Acidimicrobiales bacterium]
MSDVTITGLGAGRFGVRVVEGTLTTDHEVTVPGSLIDDLGLAGADQGEIVRQTFLFLLEREPATSILRSFSLDQVQGYFGDYYGVLQDRLGTAGERQ